MIAKKVPTRSPGKSDYGYLVQYLTDRQGKHERLGLVSVTNCQSDDWRVAVTEILNTQQQNTRAVSDKTCHLIVSFRAGEQPDAAALKAVEVRVCGELGYQDHQRVCVVHHDTDNLHMHIAINKIHPTRHTIHDPYHDHRTLGRLCETLEREYGFQCDNHCPARTGSENRALDMERHTGVQSLLGWIQRECAQTMRQACSWPELHAILAENGLRLQERGNGLVITDGTGLGVKASSVARQLSKSALEGRLGTFEPADDPGDVIRTVQARMAGPVGEPETAVTDALAAVTRAAQQRLAHSLPVGRVGAKPPPQSRNGLRGLSQLEILVPGRRRYRMQPAPSRYDTAKLYASYLVEQQNAKAARAVEGAKLTERKLQLIESARQAARLKREVAGAFKGTRVGKRILYSAIGANLKKDLRSINRHCAAERLALEERYRWRPWADWLRVQAVQGNPEALAALRSREAAAGLKGDTITATGEGKRQYVQVAPQVDCITKKGTIIYHVGSTAVRDDGDKLKVSRGCDLEGVQAALCLALKHYGNCVSVDGTQEFKELVARAAAVGCLPLTFADRALESRRQQLSRDVTIREGVHEHNRERDRQGEKPGAATAGQRSRGAAGPVSRGVGRSGNAAAGDRQIRTGRGEPVPRLAGGRHESDLGGVGPSTPPQGQDRLRELSELDMVQLAGRAPVLLPRDVPDRLERQGAQPNHGVRRDIPGPGAVTAGQAAADTYIAEREAMRLKAAGVPKHLRHDAAPLGIPTAFAGLRRIEGQMLALLSSGEEILVLPVDAGTARRLKRVALGELVTVTARGTIAKVKGRKI